MVGVTPPRELGLGRFWGSRESFRVGVEEPWPEVTPLRLGPLKSARKGPYLPLTTTLS